MLWPIMKAPFLDTAPCCGADMKVMREHAEAHLAGEEALLRLKETCAATERQLQVRKGWQRAGT